VLFELALVRMFMTPNSQDLKCVYMAPTKVRLLDRNGLNGLAVILLNLLFFKALCSERYRDWTAKLDSIGIKCKRTFLRSLGLC
jgi:ATP-dependent DNA helicase HFM1/MER3